MKTTIEAQASKAKQGTRALAPFIVVYVTLALFASAIMTMSARKVPYYHFDLAITRRLQAYRSPWFERLVGLICSIGYPAQANVLGITLLGLLYGLGYRWEAISTLFATLGSSLTSLALVLYVNRPRPSDKLVRVSNELPTTSFPSGHTLIFTAVLGFLTYLVIKSSWPRILRAPLLLVLSGIVGLMGPARIYSGEHWASDVAAGYLIGSTWLALSVKFYHWGQRRFLTTRFGEHKWQKRST